MDLGKQLHSFCKPNLICDLLHFISIKRPTLSKVHQQRYPINLDAQQLPRTSTQQLQQFNQDQLPFGIFRNANSDSTLKVDIYEDQQNQLDGGFDYETDDIELGSTTTIVTSATPSSVSGAPANEEEEEIENKVHCDQQQLLSSYPSSPEAKRLRFNKPCDTEDTSRVIGSVLKHTAPHQQTLADH